MNLQNVLDSLASSTLSNWSGADKGSIKPTMIKTVVNAINDALVKIYSETVVEERSLYLVYQEGMTNYEITPEHVAPDPKQVTQTKYLLTPLNEEFKNDLLKILTITSEDTGAIPLNNCGNPASAFTPVFNKVQIPNGRHHEVFFITYQARHPELTEDVMQELKIPAQVFPMLKDYVGYLIYSAINTQQTMAVAVQCLQSYNANLQLMKDMDLLNQSYSQDSTKFTQRGWV